MNVGIEAGEAVTVTAPSEPDVSRRARPHLAYAPALDGLRALAVIAVLLSHAGFRWARGGFLGVTTFFVLSGFLICGLLLVERDSTGRISLRSFWARRARRLVPGVLVLVALVAGYYFAVAARPSRGVVGDALAAMTWVGNWRFVLAHRSYADLFSQASPFQHTWSLAVEEQFYVVAPLLVAGLLAVGAMWHRHRTGLRRWPLAAVVVSGIAASTVAAAVLHPAGAQASRAYYGTDARAA